MFLLTQSHLRIFEGVVHAADRLIDRYKPPTISHHLVTGVRGEESAFFFLRRQGYTVVAQRYRSGLRPGDIDLIAWEEDTLCFIEVKTRSSRSVATAEASVDEEKRITLRRLANVYLRSLSPRPHTRFDIVSVYPSKTSAPEFELFRGAFDWY
jgi:putative endonuclease